MAKAKTTKGPATDSLLVELLTEELPPKSLNRLSEAFADSVFKGLKEKFFLNIQSNAKEFATPRRLAVRVSAVLANQPDRVTVRKGPSVQAALDASGQPTQSLLGFARSSGVEPSKLERRKDDKGEYFVYQTMQKGEPLATHLSAIVEDALKNLPVAKVMHWGSGKVEFARPVHGLVMLYGNKVIPGSVLGLKSGKTTLGHRFMGRGLVVINHGDNYEKALEKKGYVIPDPKVREQLIVNQLDKHARQLGKDVTWTVGKNIELLGEVASLVEYPVVYRGNFDRQFLQVPEECLIVTMQQHQRDFPLRESDLPSGKLLPYFLFVSNIGTNAPEDIIHGNERVLHARLSDAKFFYDQDRKTKLADRIPRLAKVVYHNKLGSQLERVKRIQQLAGKIAHQIGADPQNAERAAWLSKADLLTEMVGEFPELQGIMGRYYAMHDREPQEVANAIEGHYRPRFGGGALPSSHLACAVALADKLDLLAGLFGIGQVPTGERDPFGLRRAALGVIRILMEESLPLDVVELFETARGKFAGQLSADVSMNLHAFFMDRLRPYLRDRGYAPDEIDAVLAVTLGRLDHVLPRLDAVKKFRALPEGMALSAANKRIHNILRQAYPHLHLGADGYELRQDGSVGISRNSTLLREDAERNLDRELQSATADVGPMLGECNYAAALRRLAVLRPAVDGFFDKVMVMVDDADVRNNRLALLKDLGNLFLRIADVSRLQGKES